MRPTCERCDFKAWDECPVEDFEYDGWTIAGRPNPVGVPHRHTYCDECAAFLGA